MKNQFVTTSASYEALKWVALQYLFSPESRTMLEIVSGNMRQRQRQDTAPVKGRGPKRWGFLPFLLAL